MSATPLSNRRQWLVLLGLTLGVTVTNGFARFAYGLLLPAMQHEMGWGYAQAGWLNTANAFGYILGAVGTMLAIRWVTPAWLFVVGLVSTALALLATGLDAALWWQTVWRVLAGIFGAMSFSTAGALTAGLFANDPRRNALAIAILFGTGGGLGIVLAGAVLPPMLALYGPEWWPMGWVLIGLCSCVFVPLGVWAGWQMRPPPQAHRPTRIPLPKRQMLAMFGGYAGFGLGYIVYLTFLSAWMTAQATSAGFIALVWVVLGLCISLSPVIWRPVFARFSNGVPLCLILLGIAVGSALPVVLPNGPALLISAVVFGLCVFMAPGAVTNFVRQNLPAASWGQAISTFTVVFSVAQTLGPYGAGLVGDMAGSIGTSLLAAAGILVLGAGVAVLQRPLRAASDGAL